MKPLFSVIIAVYNREEYIRQSIDSVLSQTYRDYELIVVDDGSTDDTPDVLRSYGDVFKVIRQENQGSEMAYKAGVSQACGEYVAFLDSDDYFFPNALAIAQRIITELSSPPLIITAMERFEQDENAPKYREGMDDRIEVHRYPDYLSKDVSIGLAQSRIIMKKTLFEQVQNGTGIPRARNMNDYRLILRAGTYGPCVIVTRPVTLAYRYHATQSCKNIGKMCQGALYLMDIVRHRQSDGGRSRRFDRYAYLGGIVNEWSRNAYRSRLRWLALKIVIIGWPMVTAAFLKKALFAVRRPSTAIIIENLQA